MHMSHSYPPLVGLNCDDNPERHDHKCFIIKKKKKGKQKTIRQNKRLPWRIDDWDIIVKFRALGEERVCDEIGLISNQSVPLLNKLTGNTRLLNVAWLDWSKFYKLGACISRICACMYVVVWTITITHTVLGGWVWPSANSRRGSISEKEDQWGSQPASYGGLRTFHDLRDARPRSNQLYSVSTLTLASPSVQL